MDSTRITQQTSTTLPLRGELTHDAPTPKATWRGTFTGPLQWALEGRGWSILRPAVDLVLLCAAVTISLGGLHATLYVSSVRAPLLALPPLVMLLFYLRGLYQTRLRTLVLDGIVPVLSGVSVAAMAVATLGMLLNGQLPNQTDWLRGWLFSLIGVAIGRIVLSFAQRLARARHLVGKSVLIMGAGVVGAQVARRLESHPEYGLVPIGFLDEDPRSVAEVGGRDVPVLGTIDDLDETVQRTGVRHLIVAFSSAADARVSRLIQRCQELGVEVSVVPRMFDTINDRVGYDTVGGLPLLTFAAVDLDGLQFAIKHALDRVLALTLLIAFSPVLLCAAVAVRLSSPGPAFFRQRRVGRDGKVFDFYKFRSMRVEQASAQQDAQTESSALDFLLGGDTAPGGVEGEDRRTAVGRFLRSTSLDELPQLFNVLRGDMSLVGPRPERPEFVELFRQDIIRYGDRHRVKSGITGWAQVHGLRGQTSLAERVEWDNYYIAHWSLGLDLKILALTVVALFRNAE
ncbi:MAG TPA: exopolysaccharide biosynthesis polyprenyl glycosylphosphotransferase [Solirubrobacteraceae bacterium]|jgi:exopolysaccharide biosynthesis polyprenyl glycosylphosphotransferase|nr:exopolysaccharide biosynthesis polyprenyl glycosylphosphotransferase [Solirubrobacteraceae bacterium]